MNFKKIAAIALGGAMMMSLMAGCGNNGTNGEGDAGVTGPISVVSREDGSGTRGAFIELFGVEQKNAEGKKVDNTINTAEVTNSTAVMKTTVSGNTAAIGYISLGTLDDSVKPLQIDGVDANVENIKNGTYTIARPFNIATTDTVSDAATDFIAYIMSDEGQKIVEDNGYISTESAGAYAASAATGKVTVAGSSSVSPLMEKLAEGYMAVNANVTIELQTSDSTTGITSAAEGLCDIGMASRDLKDSETGAGLTSTAIAMDGIVVVVNDGNPLTGLTTQQVCDIYTGAVTTWDEVQ